MARQVPEEIDAPGFEAKLGQCSNVLQEMVAFLRTVAQNAGSDVRARRYKHPGPNTGWGITYYTQGKRFCGFDPKPVDGHVWVFIQNADSAAIVAERFEPSKQKGWFKIRTMQEAVRFEKWVVRAHDERCSGR